MAATVTNDEIAEFIALVDDARRQIAPSEDEAIGPNADAALATPRVENYKGSQALYARIHDLVVRQDDKPGPNIRQLQGALTKRSVLDPRLDPYRDIVWRLRHGTSTDKRYRDFRDRTAWVAAIQLADQLSEPPLAPTHGLEREVAVATAVKKLRQRGYLIDPDNDGFLYREGELERVCRELHNQVAKIGGQRLLHVLLTYLRKTASIENGRYLVCRPSRSLSGGDVTPSIPWGYLLNVALKHLGANVSSDRLQEIVADVIELSTTIVASLDIEHYYMLTPMFQTHETLPGYLQEVVVGDHVLTFRQIAAEDALVLIRGVFSWVDSAAMRARLGWGLEDAYKLAARTLLGTSVEAVNGVFTRQSIYAIGLSKAVVDSMQDYFVHRSADVNAKYLTPIDADKSNASSKPFVMLADGSFMMVSPPIASIGFYEALASATRVISPEADNRIGTAMEETLANAFREHNIQPSVTSGKYAIGNEILECDIVVESDDAVILFELKKKSLTGKSYAGNMSTAFLDLCSSALAAQLQLGRHELRLRETGKIGFLDGTIVEWRNRRIERVAVSLLDWGGTQDRFVIQRIASNLIGATLTAPGLSSSQTNALASVQETLSELLVQQKRLEQLGVKAQDQLHNWWFLSMPQTLFALNGVSGPNDFYRDLRLIRQIHTGTMDFYRDLTHMRRARSRAS